MFKRKLLAITDAGQEVFQHPDLKKILYRIRLWSPHGETLLIPDFGEPCIR